MEIRNQYVIYIALIILVVLYIFSKKDKKETYIKGKKVIGMSYVQDEPYYKKKLRLYHIFSKLALVLCVAIVLNCALILARPYKITYKDKESYNRDIMICLDVSTSVDELNLELVKSLKNTVKELQGERFGIVIFNTSSILLVPLTDDYEYVIKTLDDLANALNARLEGGLFSFLDDEWVYCTSYLEEGTLVSNEERGSSLIGDGLASTVFNFGDLDSDRTRVVILATDNDLYGEPYYTLMEAATLCKEKNIVVYGIGTKEMTKVNKEDMESAILKTGGKFYVQGVDNTTKEIVQEINATQKSLVKSDKLIVEEDIVKLPFIIMLSLISLMYISLKIIKH